MNVVSTTQLLIIDCFLKDHLHLHRHSLKLNGLYVGVGVGMSFHSSSEGKKDILVWKHVRVSKWWQKSVFWVNYSCKCACSGSMACVCWLWWESKCVLFTGMFILSSPNLFFASWPSVMRICSAVYKKWTVEELFPFAVSFHPAATKTEKQNDKKRK